MGQHHQDVALTALPDPRPGPYLAVVIGHLDPTFMGGLEVEILRPVGNSPRSGEIHQVKYMSPFYGVTGSDYVSEQEDNYQNTQKSYGMWMVPPDPGSVVMIIFVDGDPKKGYWMGCVPDFSMNFMVPGIASTENLSDDKKYNSDATRSPVAEYNFMFNDSNTNNPTRIKKPQHPFAAVLKESGLDKDDIRGTTTSSARREAPCMVFGISTPGPIDKQSGAKRGKIGTNDHPLDTFVSRLGGSTFVMDDGDDKFLRKKPASEDKPDYVSKEESSSDGDVTIPHNELVRIRTRKGHQILLHNSEDLIYIAHGSGKSWIEMTANGKIDVYSKDSMSFHTDADFNFSAAGDINFTSAKNINLNAVTDVKMTAEGNIDLNSNASIRQTSTGKNETKAGGDIIETGANIHMNGPGAASAAKAPVANRRPGPEPWKGHENLNPKNYTSDKTKAVDKDSYKEPEAEIKYTIPDTFNKHREAPPK
jgi:hypothetical protein